MHILIRAHGAVAYRESLFAEETPCAAMEATLPKGSKAEARHCQTKFYTVCLGAGTR